jgi:hypothetical protein
MKCATCQDEGRVPWMRSGMKGSSPCTCCAGAGHYWDYHNTDGDVCVRCGVERNPVMYEQPPLFEGG